MKAKRPKRNTPENVERVAAAFLEELTGWFLEDDVVATPDHIANGNDHYDANMAMDAALRKCGFNPFSRSGGMSQDTTDLFNNAWTRAVEMAKEKAA